MSFGCSSNGSVRNDLALTNAVVSDTLSVNKLKANGAAITNLCVTNLHVETPINTMTFTGSYLYPAVQIGEGHTVYLFPMGYSADVNTGGVSTPPTSQQLCSAHRVLRPVGLSNFHVVVANVSPNTSTLSLNVDILTGSTIGSLTSALHILATNGVNSTTDVATVAAGDYIMISVADPVSLNPYQVSWSFEYTNIA